MNNFGFKKYSEYKYSVEVFSTLPNIANAQDSKFLNKHHLSI